MYSRVIEKAPFSNLVIEHANVTGKCKMESSSSSGNVRLTTTSEPPASTVTTHTKAVLSQRMCRLLLPAWLLTQQLWQQWR